MAVTTLVLCPIGAQDLSVTILSPPPGQPVFGEVDFSVETYPPDLTSRVEFFLDGKALGEADLRPFRLLIDVGEENREHRFEVRAHGLNGEVADALLVTPAIRVDEVVEAELQQLYVTVSNGDLRVLDLLPEQFAIIDNGSRQELVTFARGDVRLTAAILIDSSASMVGERLRSALRGASVFVQKMKEDDNASIFLFSDRLLFTTPFSNDLQLLTQGLDSVRAAGGTALNDHLYIALKRLEAQQGRRVVIVLTDGIDSHSVLRMNELTWLARRSRALIYWIRTDPRREARKARFSAWKGPDEYRDEYEQLSSTVIESGGRIVDLQRLEEANDAFREILQELREQYVLGYYPSNRRDDGSWHQTHVRVDGNNLRVRAQRGYVDY